MSTMSIEQQLESLDRRQKEIQRNKLELSRKLKQREKAQHAKRVKMIGEYVINRSEKGSAELQAIVIAYLSGLKKKSEQELFTDYYKKYGIEIPGQEQEQHVTSGGVGGGHAGEATDSESPITTE